MLPVQLLEIPEPVGLVMLVLGVVSAMLGVVAMAVCVYRSIIKASHETLDLLREFRR